jgi:hypothetical protein
MIVETGELRPVARVPHRGWMRPLMAAVAALTIAMGGVVGAYLLTGRTGAGAGRLAGWAPAKAAIYAEVDASLPGDQRANLKSLLARWPALDPNLVLGTGFAAWVDGLLGDTNAPFTYRDDVAPWLSGTAAVILPAWPDLAGFDGNAVPKAVPEMAVVVGSRDRAAAIAFTDHLRELATNLDMTFTSSTVAGTTVWSLAVPPGGTSSIANAEMAYAVADDAVVVGTGSDVVGSLLATHAGSASLANDAEVGRLVAALPSPRVGLAVVDSGALLAALRQQFGNVYDNLPGMTTSGHMVEGLSLLADRLVATSASLASDAVPTTLAEPLAARIPADALAYTTMPQVGKTLGASIQGMLAAFGANPMAASPAADWPAAFEHAVGFPLADLFSWAGDGAAYATWGAGAPSGGLVLLTADPAAATAQLDKLTDAVVGLAHDGGTQLVVAHHDANGVPVTTIDVPGMADGPTVAFAVADDAVIITVGDPSAPDRLLGLDPGSSLASSSRFMAAAAAVGGGDTAPTTYLDLAGILSAVAAQIPADARSEFDMFIRPNLAPLDHVVAGTHVEAGVLVQRVELVLK